MLHMSFISKAFVSDVSVFTKKTCMNEKIKCGTFLILNRVIKHNKPRKRSQCITPTDTPEAHAQKATSLRQHAILNSVLFSSIMLLNAQIYTIISKYPSWRAYLLHADGR